MSQNVRRIFLTKIFTKNITNESKREKKSNFQCLKHRHFIFFLNIYHMKQKREYPKKKNSFENVEKLTFPVLSGIPKPTEQFLSSKPYPNFVSSAMHTNYIGE